MLGPRSFGAFAIVGTDLGRQINTQADARMFARRAKAAGAVFLKVHDQVTRRKRQWLAVAAREAGINITAHNSYYGGRLSLSNDMDGFTGREHSDQIVRASCREKWCQYV